MGVLEVGGVVVVVVVGGEGSGRSFGVATGGLTEVERYRVGLGTRCSGRLDSRL